MMETIVKFLTISILLFGDYYSIYMHLKGVFLLLFLFCFVLFCFLCVCVCFCVFCFCFCFVFLFCLFFCQCFLSEFMMLVCLGYLYSVVVSPTPSPHKKCLSTTPRLSDMREKGSKGVQTLDYLRIPSPPKKKRSCPFSPLLMVLWFMQVCV